MPIRPISKSKKDLLDDEEYEDELMEGEEELEDDFDDEYEYEERSKLVPYIVMGAALIAFISLGYYAYNSGNETIQDDELMLIQAEQTPVKEKPIDAGGMQFPYQDKSVFETITADNTTGETAQVVSNIEEPMQIEPENSTLNNAANAADDAEQTEVVATTATSDETLNEFAETKAEQAGSEDSAGLITAESLVKEAQPEQAAESTTPEPQAVQSVDVAEPETTTAAASASSSATPSANLQGSGTVQLGAYRSEVDAQNAWKKISGQYASLSGFSPLIVRADLGEKGVYHRLRVENTDAANMCASLKTAGQPCITVK